MDKITAVAEAWASIDGKLDRFRAEKDMDPMAASNTGTYEGYMVEAEELIKRMETRGFTVTSRG